jgi:hypothetical protein
MLFLRDVFYVCVVCSVFCVPLDVGSVPILRKKTGVLLQKIETLYEQDFRDFSKGEVQVGKSRFVTACTTCIYIHYIDIMPNTVAAWSKA